MRCLRKSGLDRRHMAEAALVIRDVMSREEQKVHVERHRFVELSTRIHGTLSQRQL